MYPSRFVDRNGNKFQKRCLHVPKKQHTKSIEHTKAFVVVFQTECNYLTK